MKTWTSLVLLFLAPVAGAAAGLPSQQAGVAHTLKRRPRIGERLPRAHRAEQSLAVRLVLVETALVEPARERLAQHVGVAHVLPLDDLELDLLPALAQYAPRHEVGVAAVERERVEERAKPALPVDEGAVAVEGADANGQAEKPTRECVLRVTDEHADQRDEDAAEGHLHE